MNILLKNAFVIDKNSPKHLQHTDVYIENGKISAFKDTKKADKILDLQGKHLTYGWFDLNANFNDPGREHKEDLYSGMQTACLGGFTDVNLISDTKPPIETKSDIKYLFNASSPEVDLHVTAVLSKKMECMQLNELLDANYAGAMSFGDGDFPIWNTELMVKALRYTSQMQIPIFQNPRDKYLSLYTQMHEGEISTMLGVKAEPSLSEELIILRDLKLLEEYGGKLHFNHISTKESVTLIKKAKQKKLNVTCGVGIHHLIFTDSAVENFDTNFKTLPPYRSLEDREALIEGLSDGTIDVICSNHRPQNTESKCVEFDQSIPGNISLQTFYPVLLMISEKIPFEDLTNKITVNPRKIIKSSNLGTIILNNQAKLTILDPDKEWKYDMNTNKSKSINSPFWEHTLKGKPYATINNNTVTLL